MPYSYDLHGFLAAGTRRNSNLGVTIMMLMMMMMMLIMIVMGDDND